jgi:hypothetical protein
MAWKCTFVGLEIQDVLVRIIVVATGDTAKSKFRRCRQTRRTKTDLRHIRRTQLSSEINCSGKNGKSPGRMHRTQYQNAITPTEHRLAEPNE